MRSTTSRLTIIAGCVILLIIASTITNRGFASRAIVFNGTNQFARVTLPNSAPWTSLGAFKIMGRLRGMSSIGGYITTVGIPDVSAPFNLYQGGGADPKRIDLYDSRDSVQDFHAPNTFTDVVFKLQYDPANSRWTLETWKADGTGYVVTTETITTTTNWNLGGQLLTLGANPYGVALSDAHMDWWCWQQGADATGSGNFPGAEAPATGTFLVKYTFDNDNGSDSSGNGLNLTLHNSPTFENTPGGDTTPPTISNLSHNPSSSSAVISWNTNEAATSRVFFDTVSRPSDTNGSLYAQSSTNDLTADSSSHSVTLNSLASSTPYFYKVRSADAAGNATFSTEQSFSTSAAGTTPSFVRLIIANVQHGQGTDGFTIHSRQTKILTRDTDIVCLQERGTTDNGWDSDMSAAGFTEEVYRENDPSQGDGPSIWVRNSTVTVNQRYDVELSNGAIGHDGSTNVDKAAVALKVTVAGKQFYVVNTHLCWSACADSSGSHSSTTRVNQINTLLNWINTTLTGGLDVLIVGDMNFGPLYPKNTSTTPLGVDTQRGIFLVDYEDLWEKGVNTGKATALWPDRNGDGALDMPITIFDSAGNNTRTHDERRIDYAFLKKTASNLALHNIDLPDLRAGCSGVIPSQSWGFTDDLGVRPSDHNWIKLTLLLK